MIYILYWEEWRKIRSSYLKPEPKLWKDLIRAVAESGCLRNCAYLLLAALAGWRRSLFHPHLVLRIVPILVRYIYVTTSQQYVQYCTVQNTVGVDVTDDSSSMQRAHHAMNIAHICHYARMEQLLPDS